MAKPLETVVAQLKLILQPGGQPASVWTILAKHEALLDLLDDLSEVGIKSQQRLETLERKVAELETEIYADTVRARSH